MKAKLRRGSKRSSTQFATEWFLSSMNSFVFNEVTLLSEGLIAVFALVGLVALMPSLMEGQ